MYCMLPAKLGGGFLCGPFCWFCNKITGSRPDPRSQQTAKGVVERLPRVAFRFPGSGRRFDSWQEAARGGDGVRVKVGRIFPGKLASTAEPTRFPTGLAHQIRRLRPVNRVSATLSIANRVPGKGLVPCRFVLRQVAGETSDRSVPVPVSHLHGHHDGVAVAAQAPRPRRPR
jgi:hypothetical protein